MQPLKESITVDLRSDGGAGWSVRSLSEADVVLENFPVRTLGRYGLDCAFSLPGLVYVSCTGTAERPVCAEEGLRHVFQAMGGIRGPHRQWRSVSRKAGADHSGCGSPSHPPPRSPDAAQPGGAATSISDLDGQVALLTLAAARYFALGEVPPRLGTEHPGRVPSATFQCRDGRYAHITASDQHWAPLCKALDLGEWGAAFASNAIRVERRDEVMRVLNDVVSKWGREELIEKLDNAQVPVGPVNDVAEILNDPHVRARRLVGSFDYPGVGEFKALALPYKFLGWDNPEIGRPPALRARADLAELGRNPRHDRPLFGQLRSRPSLTGQARNALGRPDVRGPPSVSKVDGYQLVFLRGNGPVFCAGADVKERAGMSVDQVRARRLKAFAAYHALESLPMPSVAVVHGAALGSGVEIAAACDFIVATPDAAFGTPEAMRGTVGATQRLPRVLGKRLAKDLMFTGRRLTAAEARAAGFVSRVVAAADLDHELSTIAHAVAAARGALRRKGASIAGRPDPEGRAGLSADGDRSAARSEHGHGQAVGWKPQTLEEVL